MKNVSTLTHAATIIPAAPTTKHHQTHTHWVRRRCLKIKENRPVSCMYRGWRSERRKPMKNGWGKKSTSPPPQRLENPPQRSHSKSILLLHTHLSLSVPNTNVHGVCEKEDKVGTHHPKPFSWCYCSGYTSKVRHNVELLLVFKDMLDIIHGLCDEMLSKIFAGFRKQVDVSFVGPFCVHRQNASRFHWCTTMA